MNKDKNTTPAAEEVKPAPKQEEAKPTEAMIDSSEAEESSTGDKDLTEKEEKVIISIGEELEGLKKEYKEKFPDGIYSKYEMFRVLEKDNNSQLADSGVKKTSMVYDDMEAFINLSLFDTDF